MNTQTVPRFLTEKEVLEIHNYQTQFFGGAIDLRDDGLLRSAVATPQASFGGNFLYADIFEMAAAYWISIIGNHPFVDGNKRTGAMSAAVFLELNNHEFIIDEDVFIDAVIRSAQGLLSVPVVASLLRNNCLPR